MKEEEFRDYVVCYGRTEKYQQQKCLGVNPCSRCILKTEGYKELKGTKRIIQLKLGRVLILGREDELLYTM